jgi:D-3-phosphoglycerate dehydrogenase
VKKVLITDSVHDCLVEGLEGLGYKCERKEGIDRASILNIIKAYTGIIINSRIIIDKEIIDKATRLKFLGRTGSGMEIVDQNYAKEKGICCISSPEGNRNAVAEHALGLLLALSNNIIRCNSEVKGGVWRREENRGFELEGKTIAIIGFGHTGKAFAQKLRGFNVEILGYDKYKKGFSDTLVKEASLNDVFSKADVLSLHLPLTNETEYWFNKETIANFSNAFYLINTSRGKVVNTFDLIKGLESEKILGAGLDVFENEKFDSFSQSDLQWYSALKSKENLVMSPHVAGWSIESKYKMSRILFEKIALVQ